MTDAPTPTPTPQDAARPEAERAPSERPGSFATPPATTTAQTVPTEAAVAPQETTPVPPTRSEATQPPEVTYLPAPSGPNWGLVVLGLLFLLVAGGVAANQLMGFQVTQLTEVGPSVLVVGGLSCAAVGAIGILARRR